jgi:hypothetical protein
MKLKKNELKTGGDQVNLREFSKPKLISQSRYPLNFNYGLNQKAQYQTNLMLKGGIK